MDTTPAVFVLLTTYNRTGFARRTIQGIRQNLIWPNIGWYISDDGSEDGHVRKLINEIGPTYLVHVYNSQRRGVGHGMNVCLKRIFEMTPLVLVLEDDWELRQPLELAPFVNLLQNNEQMGMVRMGYISANLLGYSMAAEGEMLWRLEPNGETYRFTGHPSLRHRRFHEAYGYYAEGRSAGQTELSMCGNVNAKPGGPFIVFPARFTNWGAFAHIGAESLKDIDPEKR